ncbi:hypothetical protein AAY473_037528 [Plecturocebus cupreus]
MAGARRCGFGRHYSSGRRGKNGGRVFQEPALAFCAPPGRRDPCSRAPPSAPKPPVARVGRTGRSGSSGGLRRPGHLAALSPPPPPENGSLGHAWPALKDTPTRTPTAVMLILGEDLQASAAGERFCFAGKFPGFAPKLPLNVLVGLEESCGVYTTYSKQAAPWWLTVGEKAGH